MPIDVERALRRVADAVQYHPKAGLFELAEEGYGSPFEASSPEATMAALEPSLSRELWLEINRLLGPFGKHVCTSQRPRRSTCPVAFLCPQAGMEDAR